MLVSDKASIIRSPGLTKTLQGASAAIQLHVIVTETPVTLYLSYMFVRVVVPANFISVEASPLTP